MVTVCGIAAAGLAAAALIVGIAGPALAGPDSVQLRNAGDATIADVRVSRDYESNWGQNRLPTSTLPPGESARVPIGDLGPHCYFDVKVQDTSGQETEYWGIDLCTRAALDVR